MSFIDMVITRRQFAARYQNVGRSMLGQLADIYGLDINLAEHWADEIDREAEQEIAATSRALRGGIEGAAPEFAVPSTQSNSVAPYPAASPGGANLAGAGCTAAPVLSIPAAFGSHGGTGVAADLSTATPVNHPN
jgi:hypothetical protein